MKTPPLLLIGPSARAMAYSAKRAGFEPICIDLFADTDLQAIAHVEVIPLCDYPQGFIERLSRYPADIPVLYTGGLENHPQVNLELQKQRRVWGYVHPDPFHGTSVRNPLFLDDVAKKHGFHRPKHQRSAEDIQRWLIKPRASAGGRGIRLWNGEEVPATHFLEEYLEGASLSATFIRHEAVTGCVGITEQLIGSDFVHAPTPFSYVGSLTNAQSWQGSAVLRCPLRTNDTLTNASRGQMSTSDPCHDFSFNNEVTLTEELERIAKGLTEGDPYLLGLLGADFILCNKVPYLIEVNPRYTASIEMLELTTGVSFLNLQAQAFRQPSRAIARPGHHHAVGKAIYFAPLLFKFPSTGPWSVVTNHDVWSIPEYADIPAPGSVIEQGQPVLTLFAAGVDRGEVMNRLQEKAMLLDRLIG